MKHSAHTHLIFPLLSCFLEVLIVTIKYRFNEKSNISWGNFLESVKVSFQLDNISFNFFFYLYVISTIRNRHLVNSSCLKQIYKRFNVILHNELLVQNFIRSRRESLDSRRKFETFPGYFVTKLVARENLLKLN